jgi:hypothetical protein
VLMATAATAATAAMVAQALTAWRATMEASRVQMAEQVPTAVTAGPVVWQVLAVLRVEHSGLPARTA